MNNTKTRLERSYRQTLKGEKDKILPLLCPVLEKDWLRGWDYTMIFSKSGVAEKGCTFETNNDFGSFQWIMTKVDSATSEIQFVKFMPNQMLVMIDIKLEDGEGDIVYCQIDYTFTAINDDYLETMHEENTQEIFNSHMKLWEDAMNYYLTTGKML